jgi:hypothetical protein
MKHRKRTSFQRYYFIGNDKLTELKNVRDLGVLLDHKLRFNAHIDSIANKGFRSLGFILRNSKEFRKPQTKIVLYNALVRSHLEYCSVESPL